MCPDNDGLRWLVKTVARGQLRRGGSLLAPMGAAGVPHGGISRHPPERCRATPFQKPQVPRDVPTPPASSPMPTVAAAQPGWLSQCQPHICSQNVSRGRETSGCRSMREGREDGGGFTWAASSWTEHILKAPVPPPGALLLPSGNTSAWAQRHGVDALLELGRWRLPRAPRRRQPLVRVPPPPPRLREAFQASRWGRGAAAARRRAEKAIFSRYIFYKLNILCISALPVKASRAQPWDSTSEPVSQQRLAATWPAGTERGREPGSPHTEGQAGGSP